MTSYDDRPNNDPWAPPAWSPPQAAHVRPPLQAPGLETRQLLLVLGAACLIAALAAGTAVVWRVLGPNGQAALMALVTATLLVLAVRLERLPATAQALGAVGVAGLLIDAAAGRSLELAGVRDLPLHVYAGLAASTVALLLGGMSLTVRRLWAPPIGAAIAAVAAVVAWTHPATVDGAAWLGVAVLATAVLVERVLAEAGPAAVAGRFVNAALAFPLAGIGAVASIVAATWHGDGTWAGVVLVVLLLALPEATGVKAVEGPMSLAAGGMAGALVVASCWRLAGDTQVAVAVGMAMLGVAVGLVTRLHEPLVRVRRAVQVACLTCTTATYALVSADLTTFAHINVAYAVVCLAIAIGCSGQSENARVVRGGAAVSTVLFATVGVDLLLHLHGVTTPEPYVLVPALGLVVLGAAAMYTWPETSSWVLAPGLVLGLLPTVSRALGHDGPRQALALGAAAVLVIIGAQLRLAGPLSVGAGVLSLVVLRLVGPEVKRVPEWVALGVVGIVLLMLGATWESRMLDVRRAAHALRPRIAALR